MRTLFLTCIAFLGISAISFAQESTNTTIAQTKSELVAGKQSGDYKFVLPIGVSTEAITKSAKYYVNYFTVEYTEKTREAKIKMLINDDKSRHVITRYLTSCGTQYVTVEGKTISTEDFFVNYLK
jgi:hypothetical protein